jgi:hypothetical protein
MKKNVFVLIFLSLFLFSGCAGYGVILQPDVYVSGDFGPPRWYYYSPYYGPFWEYSVLTVINGSRYELKVIQDGSQKGIVPPGQHLRLLIKNYYNESRQVGMIAVAYSGGQPVGTAVRTFYFYGSSYSRQSETWQITDWDIRRGR